MTQEKALNSNREPQNKAWEAIPDDLGSHVASRHRGFAERLSNLVTQPKARSSICEGSASEFARSIYQRARWTDALAEQATALSRQIANSLTPISLSVQPHSLFWANRKRADEIQSGGYREAQHLGSPQMYTPSPNVESLTMPEQMRQGVSYTHEQPAQMSIPYGREHDEKEMSGQTPPSNMEPKEPCSHNISALVDRSQPLGNLSGMTYQHKIVHGPIIQPHRGILARFADMIPGLHFRALALPNQLWRHPKGPHWERTTQPAIGSGSAAVTTSPSEEHGGAPAQLVRRIPSPLSTALAFTKGLRRDPKGAQWERTTKPAIKSGGALVDTPPAMSKSMTQVASSNIVETHSPLQVPFMQGKATEPAADIAPLSEMPLSRGSGQYVRGQLSKQAHKHLIGESSKDTKAKLSFQGIADRYQLSAASRRELTTESSISSSIRSNLSLPNKVNEVLEKFPSHPLVEVGYYRDQSDRRDHASLSEGLLQRTRFSPNLFDMARFPGPSYHMGQLHLSRAVAWGYLHHEKESLPETLEPLASIERQVTAKRQSISGQVESKSQNYSDHGKSGDSFLVNDDAGSKAVGTTDMYALVSQLSKKPSGDTFETKGFGIFYPRMSGDLVHYHSQVSRKKSENLEYTSPISSNKINDYTTQQGAHSPLDLVLATVAYRPQTNTSVQNVASTQISRAPADEPAGQGGKGGGYDGPVTNSSCVEDLAGEVYAIIKRRLKVDRERMGLR